MILSRCYYKSFYNKVYEIYPIVVIVIDVQQGLDTESSISHPVIVVRTSRSVLEINLIIK